MTSVQAPTKPCHNCRRQRLRCDRSYPHCNKCTKAGKDCLGYGQLFRWTGAVASRGKLAGRTSSAPVNGAGAAADGRVIVSLHGSGRSTASPASSVPASPTDTGSSVTPFGGSSPASDDMQIVLSRDSSPFEPELKSPYVLVDPLFQDLSGSHRYYLSYCKCNIPRLRLMTSTHMSPSHESTLQRPCLPGCAAAQSLPQPAETDKDQPFTTIHHCGSLCRPHVKSCQGALLLAKPASDDCL